MPSQLSPAQSNLALTFESAPGLRFGPYRIERMIGVGGTARVYRALAAGWHDPSFVVAAKVARTDGRNIALCAEELAREASIARAMRHRNVIGVFDYGMHESRPTLVLEYAHFGSCARVQGLLARTDEPFPLAAAVWVTSELLCALAAIHRRGFLHRDVTLGNVLITGSGMIKLSDFGIAGQMDPSSGCSSDDQSVFIAAENIVQRYRLGLFQGKPGYVAPEQGAGLAADARADVFAAGACLAALLVGVPPFFAPTVHETLGRAARGEWRCRTSRGAEVPVELQRVLDRALAPSRRDRFATAEAFRQELWAAAAIHGIEPLDASGLAVQLDGLQMTPARSGIFAKV